MDLDTVSIAFKRFLFKPAWLTSEQKIICRKMRYIVTDATFLISLCCFKAARIHLPIICHCWMHKFIQFIFRCLIHALRLIFVAFRSWNITFPFSQLELWRASLQLIFVCRRCNETSKYSPDLRILIQ